MPNKEVEQEQQDQEVIDQLARANGIAKALFPGDGDDQTAATFEIYDLLDLADDEEELSKDLHKAKDAAAAVFAVEVPNSAQVLGCFAKLYLPDAE